MVGLAPSTLDRAFVSPALAAEISMVLADRGGLGRMSALPRTHRVADETSKAMLYNAGGEPAAFLLCSSPQRPDLIARAVRTARAARHALGDDLGRAVLLP